MNKLLAVIAVSTLAGCGGAAAGTGGGAGGGAGGGTAGGAGGGSSSGTPVTVSPTSATTAIPTVQNCTGATYGSKGDLPAVNLPVFAGSTEVTAFTLRYDMSSYFGEPTRKAVISWEGTGGLSSVQWLAEVQNPQGLQYVTGSGKRVFASYLVGSIKDAGQGFGIDSTGSPSWSQTFVTYDSSTGVANGVTDVEAKNIYRGCFKLAQVSLLKLSGNPALKR